MLTRTIGRYLSWPIDRLAAVVAPTGIPPNVITWAALVSNLWAAMLFAVGRFAAAGAMMTLAALCDLLDGPVARRQGRVSLFGGFLDSILDRYAEPGAVSRPAGLLRGSEPLPLRGAGRGGDGRRSHGQLRESPGCVAGSGFGDRILGAPRTAGADHFGRGHESHGNRSVDSGDWPEYHRHSSHSAYLEANPQH